MLLCSIIISTWIDTHIWCTANSTHSPSCCSNHHWRIFRLAFNSFCMSPLLFTFWKGKLFWVDPVLSLLQIGNYPFLYGSWFLVAGNVRDYSCFWWLKMSTASGSGIISHHFQCVNLVLWFGLLYISCMLLYVKGLVIRLT